MRIITLLQFLGYVMSDQTAQNRGLQTSVASGDSPATFHLRRKLNVA
jgi:hypothetical protein